MINLNNLGSSNTVFYDQMPAKRMPFPSDLDVPVQQSNGCRRDRGSMDGSNSRNEKTSFRLSTRLTDNYTQSSEQKHDLIWLQIKTQIKNPTYLLMQQNS